MLPKQIQAFDLDHTLLQVNCSALFFERACKAGIFSYQQKIALLLLSRLYRLRLCSLKTFHKYAFLWLFYQEKVEKFQPILQETLSLLPRLWHSQIVNRLKQAQDAGNAVFLLSSSPDMIVRPVAALLGVENWHATTYKVDNQGRFDTIDTLLDGKKKRVIVEEYQRRLRLSGRETIVYSDSWEDIEFLKTSECPIAINPDWRLRLYCKKHQWEILELCKRNVSL